MDILELFLKRYSYKFPKGYPDMKDDQDINLLANLLEEMNIDLNENKSLISLNEASISPTDLSKPFYTSSEFYGKFNDRGEKFLDKILKGEEFELSDGGKVKLDIEKSKEGIDILKSKDYKNLGRANKPFFDSDGNQYNLQRFLKNKEFGSGSGQGGGTANTSLAESTQCLFNALIYYVSEDDINDDNLKKAYSYCDVTNSLEEMIQFSQDEFWRSTFILTAKKLKSVIKGNNFTFHRGSSFVQSIYNSYSKAKQEEQISMQSDKWNPADIWMVDKSIIGYDFPENLTDLNADLAELFSEDKLIGVSLKKLGKEAKLSYVNIDKQDLITHSIVDINAIPSNKGAQVDYEGGKIYFRTFNFTAGFAGEILGKTASHGKIGVGPINDILKYNNKPLLPYAKNIKSDLENEESKLMEDFYKRYVFINGEITKEEFMDIFNTKNIDWKVSKYMALFISSILKGEDGGEILSDMLRYASSTTKLSSVYIKVS
jgi:hypothetical protein